MAKPKIRFIVETVSSARGTYGNTHHFARITSTATGKTLVIRGVGGLTNARGRVYRVVADYGAIHSVETVLPIRQWNNVEPKAPWPAEHEVTDAMILDLERVRRATAKP